MKPQQIILCGYCEGCMRPFAASHSHDDIAALRVSRWRGCCRYWLARGGPAGWWV